MIQLTQIPQYQARTEQPDQHSWGVISYGTQTRWYNSIFGHSQVARADEAPEIMGNIKRRLGSTLHSIKFFPTKSKTIAQDVLASHRRVEAMTVGGIGEFADGIAEYMQKAYVSKNAREAQKYLDYAKSLGRQEGFFSNLNDTRRTNSK